MTARPRRAGARTAGTLVLCLAALLAASDSGRDASAAAGAQVQSEPSETEVREYFKQLEDAFAAGEENPAQLDRLLSTGFEDDFESDGRGRMRERLASASGRGDRIEFDVLRVASRPLGATGVVRTRVAGGDAAESQLDFFVLRREGGALVASRRLSLDEAADRRVTGRTYRAADGSFDLTAPAGFAIATPRRKVGTAYDTVFFVDPESEAYALVVAFAIPFEIDSLETMAKLDAAKLDRLADAGTPARVVSEGKISVAGLDGYQQVTHATVGGRPQVFRRVCLQRDRTCYQFLFRSSPPDAYARDSAAFDEILERFLIVSGAERPRRGTVDGNLYRHGDIGFEIATPPGWTIEEVPSSYSAQVFFTPGSGRSYAMLCALEIGRSIEPDALVTLIDEDEEERRKTVPGIARRGPPQETTVDGHPARSIVQSYPIEGFERTVKSVFVAAGSTLFVLVLNATPAEYDAFEPEFDALVASFIRTP